MRVCHHIEPDGNAGFADATAAERWLAALEPWRMELGKVQRVRLPDGRGAFLKRSPGDGAGTWQALLRGQWPQSAARREWRLLQALHAAGFDTMRPLAWGEQRRLGLPEASFLLVGEVRGQEVADLFQSRDGNDRLDLMHDVGRLVGRLHAAGFFQPVRLKDLILTDQALVLIDRETSKPWTSMFRRSACLASLARAVRRTVRDGHRLHAGSAMAFLRGYQAGLGPRRFVATRTLLRQMMAAVRTELRQRKPKARPNLSPAQV